MTEKRKTYPERGYIKIIVASGNPKDHDNFRTTGTGLLRRHVYTMSECRKALEQDEQWDILFIKGRLRFDSQAIFDIDKAAAPSQVASMVASYFRPKEDGPVRLIVLSDANYDNCEEAIEIFHATEIPWLVASEGAPIFWFTDWWRIGINPGGEKKDGIPNIPSN